VVAVAPEVSGNRCSDGQTEADFDPGAKYHVAANVPYTSISWRAFCSSSFTALWRRRPVYGAAASVFDLWQQGSGDRLNTMLSMGLSKPWPDALEAVTGQRQMDASALVEYFAPLQKWLDEQNKGKPVGW